MALTVLERKIAQAMAFEDGTSARFDDGTIAVTGCRQVRDGARVALLIVPGLVRFDLRCEADTLDFALRHLSGQELEQPMRESDPRPIETPDGDLRHEYHFEFALRDGPVTRIVLWLEQFRGELVREHRAIALITER